MALQSCALSSSLSAHLPLGHQLFSNATRAGEQNRLIHHVDGTIELAPESPAYGLGKVVLRPMIKAASFWGQRIYSAVAGSFHSVDAVISKIFKALPTAAAETVQRKDPRSEDEIPMRLPVLNCGQTIGSVFQSQGIWKGGIDGDGNVISVVNGWTQAGGSYIVAETLPAQAASWTQPAQINPPGQHVANLVMNVGAQGTALAAWQIDNPLPGHQYSIFSPGSSSWTSPADIPNWGSFPTYFPAMIASSGNDLLTIGNLQTSIQVSDFVNGGWSSLTSIGNFITSFNQAPIVVLNSNGYAAAAWHYDLPTVQAATRLPGQSWTSPATILTIQALPSMDPQVIFQLAVSDNGDAFAAAANSISLNGYNTTVQVTVLPFKSVWSSPFTLFSCASNVCPSVDSLAAVMDVNGNGALVWSTGSRLQIAVRPFEGKWTSPTTIFDGGKFKSNDPNIAADNNGNAFVVWLLDQMDSSGKHNYYLMNATCSLSNGSCTPVYDPKVYVGDGWDFSPQIKLNKKGVATMTWAGTQETSKPSYNVSALRCSMV